MTERYTVTLEAAPGLDCPELFRHLAKLLPAEVRLLSVAIDGGGPVVLGTRDVVDKRQNVLAQK